MSIAANKHKVGDIQKYGTPLRILRNLWDEVCGGRVG